MLLRPCLKDESRNYECSGGKALHMEQAVEYVKLLIKALKKKGISKIGAAGFCWGAKVVVELAKEADIIQVVALLHPSFVTLDDIKVGSIDYMIRLPAHAAVIGAWFRAWPMPLDWERTWQEWPICVTYGAIMVRMLASICSTFFHVPRQHMKGD